ncbi:MAG: hypothetical protein DDT18_01368 [Actinobacteria bacterium]|uniref:Ribbon-helix-helix protein CopG domain-containing protein n=2 Tax=Candidatus Hakubella thermalkaliphila TaxID=2754717 RepID=A0A6V8P2P7_9ACTN|nr:hypothetical protein [Actinomycetota bacterium]GFP25066.1 hypothetical protein HKBW3S25_00516 [Candidatus Hakubella thermalkaliphila]GFP27045.1 hypothetical protein HKBW3S33_00457 [Candidatus Hakubella thermalkaliphila]GFP41849.1 hypothetical protein HKBW3C_00976 [Candidatus Hakubella thermalkaliphila]
MLKPTTVRVSEDFLRELSNFIKEMDLDKSAYLRDILKKGFEEDRRDRLLLKYQAGELSAAEVCKRIGITPWEFFDLLKKKNMSLNVSLEDWLDSRGLG